MPAPRLGTPKDPKKNCGRGIFERFLLSLVAASDYSYVLVSLDVYQSLVTFYPVVVRCTISGD
jgi:hypothetical protein